MADKSLEYIIGNALNIKITLQIMVVCDKCHIDQDVAFNIFNSLTLNS